MLSNFYSELFIMFSVETINGNKYIVIDIGFNPWHSIMMRRYYGSNGTKKLYDMLYHIKRRHIQAYDKWYPLFDLIYQKKAIIIPLNGVLLFGNDVAYFKLNIYRYHIIFKRQHGSYAYHGEKNNLLDNMFQYPYTEC